MSDTHRAKSKSGKKTHKSLPSQLRLLIFLIAGIFFAEVLAMILIYLINPAHYWLETLLDASIMTVFIFPVLYYFHFRPLSKGALERNRSEALLRNVLDNLPVGVWIIDQDGAILHGNQASRKIWSGAKYVGIDRYGEYKAWRLDTGKLVEPGEWGAARAVQHGESILDEELEIECFDGSQKIILHSAVPIYDNSVIAGAIVVNQDITERKQAEQALSRSEALFKSAFQILPVGAWITDATGKIIFGNPAGQSIWAGARYVGIEQFGEYKAWWVSTGQPVAAGDWAVTRAIKNGETSLNEELEIECFDGTHKIILNSAIPVTDDQGQVYGVFVVNQDITHRKRSEQALIHSNELIQRAFNSIDILIAYMDRDFNFIQVNEAYARQGGHPAEYFPGKNHFELYPHPENQAIFQQVVETGEPYSVVEKPFEYPEFPKRGVTYWNWRVQPVIGGDGSVQGIVLSLVDVTERKRTEILLERQNQDLHNLSIAEGKQRRLAESLVQSMLTLNASLELDDVLASILEQIRLLIPYGTANIVLIENGGLRIVRQFELAGDHEVPVADERLYKLEDYPIVEKVCLSHKPVLVDTEENEQIHQVAPGLARLGACIIIPLIVGERLTGTINLCSSQTDVLTEETTRRLQAFAAPAALAIENSHLYAAEMKARQVAETLNAMSLALTQTLDFEKVMTTLLEFVCRVVPSDHSYIVIVEDEATLTLQVTRNCEIESDRIQPIEQSCENSVKPYLMEIISSRKSLMIPDVQQNPGKKTLISGVDIHSWLGIPILVSGNAIGVLVLTNTRPNFFTSEHTKLSEVIVSQASVAIQNAWLFEQVRAGHERFQSLSRRLLDVQESERRFIARELHDVASQMLTALMFGLRRLEQEVHQPENILQRLTELKRLTDQVLEELHFLAVGLRPASLDYSGLVDALGQLVKDFGARYALSVHFKATGFTREERLPDIVETNVYRIVQEALTNAARHAAAKNIDVILENQGEKTIIIIEDDGISFDSAHVPKSGHLGLLGMQERAQMMSGTLQIESVKGRGTTIVLEIPYANTNTDRRRPQPDPVRITRSA